MVVSFNPIVLVSTISIGFLHECIFFMIDMNGDSLLLYLAQSVNYNEAHGCVQQQLNESLHLDGFQGLHIRTHFCHKDISSCGIFLRGITSTPMQSTDAALAVEFIPPSCSILAYAGTFFLDFLNLTWGQNTKRENRSSLENLPLNLSSKSGTTTKKVRFNSFIFLSAHGSSYHSTSTARCLGRYHGYFPVL